MARYISVDTILFTDHNGNQFPVKDIRLIPSEVIAYEVDVNENDLLDEVASRKEVFGEFGESQSFRILDANIVKLTEFNFNLNKIRKLKIPK